MRLLIITQAIDIEHPILGFFHRWVEEFAKHCEHVHVIALTVGKHSLPTNVTVHSLGKSEGKGRLYFLFNFYKLIWNLRKEYDNVFVHMNQIYVILGAPFWRAHGKKIGLWYAHGTVSYSLRLAEKLTNKIFTASGESFKLKSHKLLITGHGIDTALFFPQEKNKTIDLITVGRITPIKDLFTLIDMLKEARLNNDVRFTIVGQGVTGSEKRYETVLREYVKTQGMKEYVNFVGKVAQKDLPDLLNQAKVFVTVAKNGSLDKAVLEAMACGLPIVSMASGNISLPLGEFQVDTKEEMSKMIKKVLESDSYLDRHFVDYVKNSHSLQSLIPNIISSLL